MSTPMNQTNYIYTLTPQGFLQRGTFSPPPHSYYKYQIIFGSFQPLVSYYFIPWILYISDYWQEATNLPLEKSFFH